MVKKLRKVLPVALAGIFALTSVALAASTVNVSGGNYTVSSNTDKNLLQEGNGVSGNSTIDFGSGQTIDVSTTIPPITMPDYIRVDDNRGQNAGWNVKVSAANFTTTVPDATAPGTVTVSIPADQILKVAASNPEALNNSKALPDTEVGLLPVPSTEVRVMYAVQSKGQGAYTGDLSYTLSLPNYLPAGSTVNASNTSSAFKNVTDPTQLGLFAGSYSTTITYSITQAP